MTAAPEWLPDVAPAASLDVDHATGGDDRALDALNASIAEERAAAERSPDVAAEVTATARRHLVSLAAALKAIGEDSYSSQSESFIAFLATAGYPSHALRVEAYEFDAVTIIVEGVSFFACSASRPVSA